MNISDKRNAVLVPGSEDSSKFFFTEHLSLSLANLRVKNGHLP